MAESSFLPGASRLRLWHGAAAAILLVPLASVGGSAHGSAAIPASGWSDSRSAVTVALPPAPAALVVREVDPQDALRINAGIPLATGSNPPAPAFSMAAASATARQRALDCLTAAIYYEAGNESADGQRAVAQVVLNRARHPAFPSSVCGVVYQGSTLPTGCQFTFTCDGSLARQPDRLHWQRARAIAGAALAGAVFGPVGTATFYHANYVVPVWAPNLAKNAAIGAHYFYRWKGSWGTPSAFAQRYAGSEPSADALKNAALSAFAERAAVAATGDGAMAPTGTQASLARQLAALDVKLTVASRTLGPKNPQLAELEKERAALSQRVPQSPAMQLAAVEAEIEQASRTLGPKHPQMLALEQRRAELLRVAGRK